MFKKACERLALDKLHRIEVVLAGFAEVKDGGNIRMTNARRRPGLAQNRSRADSSPRYFPLITFNVTSQRRSTSMAL